MGKRSDLFLFVATTLACVAVLELGFRAVSGVPILRMTDWSEANVKEENALAAAQYDPVVGWVAKPGLTSNWLNTIEHGVRKNRATDTHVRTGGLLVVGDSFAAGSEVNDDQSWPAHLETLTGEPIVNAAVGGWGVDQMVLRSEQLQAVFRPKTIILSTQDQGILRVAFSSYGAPKPYFTLKDGELVAHNQPVPQFQSGEVKRSLLVRALSYSYVAAQVMATLDPNYLLAADGGRFARTAVDDVAVSCALLERLKASNDALNIRVMVLLQYGWYAVTPGGGSQPGFADMFAQCGRDAGVEVIDTFEALRVVGERDPAELNSFFVRGAGDDRYGHMSDKGNRFIAQMLAEALAKQPEPVVVSHRSHVRRKGDGVNRVMMPEDLPSHVATGEIATLSRVEGWRARLGLAENEPSRYVLTASGLDGEHYIHVPVEPLPAGDYTFSLRAKPGVTGRLRLQLLDEKTNVAIADFDLQRASAVVTRVGMARNIQAPIEKLSGNWLQVSVTATLPGAGVRAILQLLDANGRNGFLPDGETVEISALQLEIGQSVSEYRLLRGAPSDGGAQAAKIVKQ